MIIVGDWATHKSLVKVQIGAHPILANLEGPILPETSNFKPTLKAGPNIFSTNIPDNDQRYIFSLSNNHMMDFGNDGRLETIATLKANGFLMVGSGENKLEARQPIYLEENGVKIGIIACCEAQFGVARDDASGVAEVGPWIYSELHRMKKDADFIIISIHAGAEDSPWPSPRIQELYKSFIDAGATIIHGHHSHIPQGFEEYNGGLIFYGLGNFLVEPDHWSSIPNTLWSIGAEINFHTNPFSWDLLTFEINKEEDGLVVVRNSNSQERNNHSQYIDACIAPLNDKRLLNGLWHETSLRTYFHYKAKYMNFPLEKIHKLSGVERIRSLKSSLRGILEGMCGIRKEYNPSEWNYLLWHVMFSCESHCDSIKTALGILGGEFEDQRTEQTKDLADAMMPWSVGIVPV